MARILKLTDPRTGEIYRVNWDGDEIPSPEVRKQLLLEQRAKKNATAPPEKASSSFAAGIDKVLNLPKQPLLALGAKVAGVPKIESFGQAYKDIFGLGEGYLPEEAGLPKNAMGVAAGTLPLMGALDMVAKTAPSNISKPIVGSVGEIISDPLVPLSGAPGRAVAAAGGISAGIHSADAFSEDKPLEGALYAALAALGARGSRKAPAVGDDIASSLESSLEPNLTPEFPPNFPPQLPQGAGGSIPAKKTDLFQPSVNKVPKTEIPAPQELPPLPLGRPTFAKPPLPITSPGQPVHGLDPFAEMFPQPQAHPNFVERPLDLQAEPFSPVEVPLDLPAPMEIPTDFRPPTPPENIGPINGGTASRSGVFFERSPQANRPSFENPLEFSDARDVAGLDINVAPEGPPRLSPLDQKVQAANAARQPITAGNFSGHHDTKTGTFGLRGTSGEKVGGKILDDRIEVHSVGKGKSTNSQSLIEAARELGRAQGKPVYIVPTEQSLSGGKMMDRLMQRGEVEQTAQGLLLRDAAGPKAPLVDKAYGGIPIDELTEQIRAKFPKLSVKAEDLLDFLGKRGAKNINLEENVFSFKNPDGQLVKYDLSKMQNKPIRLGDRLLRMNPRERGVSQRDAGLNPRSELPQYVGKDPKVRYASSTVPGKASGATIVPRQATLGEKIVDILNIPRTLKSTADISMPLRQGLLAMAHDPKKGFRHIGNSIKAAFNEDKFDDIMHDVVLRPTSKAHAQSGLAITVHPKHASVGQQLSQREEAWLSTLPDKIPGIGHVIRGSNRAAVGFLNLMRADIFDDLAAKYQKLGTLTPDALVAPTPGDKEFMKNIARYTNMITGRAGLGKDGERVAPLLQALLFSPRLVASRVQSMGYALPGGSKMVEKITGGKGLNPEMVSELRGDWLKLGGTGLAVASLASLIPGVTIEKDPRSADFLKIKYKNTRIDLGGGHLQYLTAGARAVTGETKTPQGDIKPAGGREGRKSSFTRHTQPLVRLAEGKLNPPASMVKTAYTGRNFLGTKFDSDNPWHWAREGTDMMTPISPQDLHALSQEQDPLATMLLGSLGILGAGVSTYDPEDPDVRNPDRFQEDIEEFIRKRR